MENVVANSNSIERKDALEKHRQALQTEERKTYSPTEAGTKHKGSPLTQHDTRLQSSERTKMGDQTSSSPFSERDDVGWKKATPRLQDENLRGSPSISGIRTRARTNSTSSRNSAGVAQQTQRLHRSRERKNSADSASSISSRQSQRGAAGTSKGRPATSSHAGRYIKVSSPVADYIRGIKPSDKRSPRRSPAVSPAPSPRSVESSPRGSPITNSGKYANVSSPVGAYIRGLSPSVLSPARRTTQVQRQQLRSALVASPFAFKRTVTNSSSAGNTPSSHISLSGSKSPSSSPVESRARRRSIVGYDKQENLISPRHSSVPSPSSRSACGAIVDREPGLPSPLSHSATTLKHEVKMPSFVLEKDVGPEQKRVAMLTKQKEEERERMVHAQRQHVARVMAAYAIARGRAKAMGVLRARAKAEAKKKTATESEKISEEVSLTSIHEPSIYVQARNDIMAVSAYRLAQSLTAEVVAMALKQSVEISASAEIPILNQDDTDLVGLRFLSHCPPSSESSFNMDSPGKVGTTSLASLDIGMVSGSSGLASPLEYQLSPDSDGDGLSSPNLYMIQGSAIGAIASGVIREKQDVSSDIKLLQEDSVVQENTAMNRVLNVQNDEVSNMEEDREGDEEDDNESLACQELLRPSSTMDARKVRIRGQLRIKPLARTYSTTAAQTVFGAKASAWKQRWVIVHHNFLYIYRTEDSARPLVVALLDNATVEVLSGNPSQFKLETRVGRQLYFEAESTTEAEKWCDELGRSGYENVQVAASRRPARPKKHLWDSNRCKISMCSLI
eukprot:CAMPEP_0171533078 /NCGR_PEP_ID=MMETSP0959-20130129/15391_1 /TAXON_ID=87120 /ORGANISM="Aurantiochytrium limacinum, Strain ATCCMYA-1381" /LENGTH=788 /DNA_ID=CAMNT_0012077857 /DNA_START=181 /DNA_END=2549 /DNA_ORIENTATION=-